MAVAKRQGRSEDQSEDFRQNKLLAKPNLHRAGPGGGKKHIKGGAKALFHGLYLPCACVYMLSLSLSLSCYLLNKIEL